MARRAPASAPSQARRPPRTRTTRDWAQAVPGLTRVGAEWVGPCPLCGGDDRFRVSERGAYCRQCLPDGKNTVRFKELIAAVFPDAEPPPKPRPKPNPGKRPTAEIGLEAWTASVNAERTPVRAYITGRKAWPPFYEIPESIRWIPAAAAPRDMWLPKHFAGAALFMFGDGSGFKGVMAEGLSASGRRGLDRWRRTFGPIKGNFFAIEARKDGLMTVITEGPLTALAAHVMADGAAVRAAGGTNLAGIMPDGPALIVVEDDSSGRVAAEKAWKPGSGHRTAFCQDGDALDELARMVTKATDAADGDEDAAWAAIIGVFTRPEKIA